MSRKSEHSDEFHVRDRERKRLAYQKRREQEDAEIAAGLRPPRKRGGGRPKTIITDEDRDAQRLRQNAYRREWVQKNKAQVRESYEARRQRARDFVNKIKEGPCTDCGNCFPVICMQFDHRPGEEKYKHGGVAKLVAVGANLDTVESEIIKCDLVCSNCHWIRTQDKNGWYQHD